MNAPYPMAVNNIFEAQCWWSDISLYIKVAMMRTTLAANVSVNRENARHIGANTHRSLDVTDIDTLPDGRGLHDLLIASSLTLTS